MFRTENEGSTATLPRPAPHAHGLRDALRSLFAAHHEHRDGPQVVEPVRTRDLDGAIHGVITSLHGPRPSRL